MEPDFSEDQDFGEKRQVIEVKASRPTWQKIVFFTVVVALIGLAIFGLTKLFGGNSDQDDKTATTSAEQKETATNSAEAASTRCNPDQTFDNPKQGYSVCYSAGWVKKDLSVSGLDTGFAPKATEPFVSTIQVYITDQTADLVIQTFNDNSSKFEFGTDSIDGKKVTQTTITRMKSDPLSATVPRAILTATTTNSRTYVVILNPSEDENHPKESGIAEEIQKGEEKRWEDD